MDCSCIYYRDVAAVESVRPIHDSENMTGIEMKLMVIALAKKGWPKNEIVYEM